MGKSHAAGWASDAPTPAQLKEFFSQVESGRITKEQFQSLLSPRQLRSTFTVSLGKPFSPLDPSGGDVKDTMKEVSLRRFFGASLLLEDVLPWVGPNLRVNRSRINAESPVQHVVSVDVRSDAFMPQPRWLRVSLITSSQARLAEALLSVDCPKAVVVGDELPLDWREIQTYIAIEE